MKPFSVFSLQFSAALLALAGCLLLCGCKTWTRRTDRAEGKLLVAETRVATNSAALTEESRALTTGALDALGYAPTNAPTDLARRFLQRDQQIEGVPVQRIDIAALLSTNAAAVKALNARFEHQDRLLVEREQLRVERDAIRAERDAARAELAELGKKYEAERSKSIWRRIWVWATGTLGITGFIVLCLLCPPVLAVVVRLLVIVIGKIPALTSLFGVVGTKVIDQVALGVEELKGVALRAGVSEKDVLAALRGKIDEPVKAVIRSRKGALVASGKLKLQPA